MEQQNVRILEVRRRLDLGQQPLNSNKLSGVRGPETTRIGARSRRPKYMNIHERPPEF